MSHRDEAEKALKEVLRLIATHKVTATSLDPEVTGKHPQEEDPELEDALHRFTYHLLEAASERDKGPIVDGRG